MVLLFPLLVVCQAFVHRATNNTLIDICNVYS